MAIFHFGDVISYLEMCQAEGVNLQRGMNFKLHGNISVILMSLRKNASYADKVENDGKTLIYEGHDLPRRKDGKDPKLFDQPMNNPSGSLTQNGLFFQAAKKYKKGLLPGEPVKVYEKLRPGIWVYNGTFNLIDAWIENANSRNVFKFRLELISNSDDAIIDNNDLAHNRMIPSAIKLEVWKRDKGVCIKCGNNSNLHFDHIIPFSKGGSSLVAENIQLLCAKHNIMKRYKIE